MEGSVVFSMGTTVAIFSWEGLEVATSFSSACTVNGVLVCVDEVVPLRVLGLEEADLDDTLRLEGRERVDPTSEWESSPLSACPV